MIAIDLFCGLGGWAEGFLAEGFKVIGFDVEQHDYGTGGYPGQLVIQDVLTLHGSQFKGATVIVASPPCQEFSYMAMPWTRGKQIAAALRGKGEFPDGCTGSRTVDKLRALFDACFRIQREASEAAGRHIPLVVENVKGAQWWVGRAPANFGSYYLWGDVPALLPMTGQFKASGMNWSDQEKRGQDFTRIAGKQASGLKTPGFRFDGSGRSFQSEAVKTTGHVNQRDGYSHTRHLTNQRESDLIKGGLKHGGDCFNDPSWPGKQGGVKQRGSGRERFAGEGKISRVTSSNSDARKAASAAIAKIPFPLSSWIAKVFKPAN